MLDKFSFTCALCYMFGKDTEKHYITACPLLDNDLKEMNITLYLRWQTTLRYSRRSGPAICFFCHIPQLDDTVHGEIQKGGNGCLRKDIIMPVAFGVFCQDPLRDAASLYFGCNWSTLHAYGQWLTGNTVSGHETNMVAVFMWYAEKIDEAGVFQL